LLFHRKFEIQCFSFKGNNIFVYFIDGLGYWNLKLVDIFLTCSLCWCICALQFSSLNLFCSIVKYLLVIFLKIPFVETPNWRASFDHNNPWLWVKALKWNYVTKKIKLTKQNMVVFNKFSKIIHDVFKTLNTLNKILFNKIHNIQRIIIFTLLPTCWICKSLKVFPIFG